MSSRLLICLCTLSVLLISCSNSTSTVSEVDEPKEKLELPSYLQTDPLANYLADIGFRPDMIRKKGDGYLVEGDIFFSEKHLDRIFKKSANDSQIPESEQWARNSVVNNNNVDDIVIKIESGVPSSWSTAITQATSAWNSMNDTNINMSVNNSSSSPDITVSMDGSLNGSNVVAYASWPQSGDPGPTVKINSDFNGFSSSQKKYNMVHELGHTIGFRHTNWQSRGESSSNANILNFTPSTDGNSVMNGGTGSNSWNGFSTYDIYGAQVLYPESLGGAITSTMEDSRYESGRVTFYFIVNYNVTGGKFQTSWLQKKVSGNWQNYSTFKVDAVGDDKFWIEDERTDTMAGTELRVKYTNYAGDVVGYSSTYTVTL